MKQRILMLAVAAWAICAVARAESAPKIQFDRMVYDFGTTSMVESVSGAFVIENTGNAELKLQKPSTSCGCTVAEIKPDTLKPGEKAELKFTFNLSNVRGPIQKTITVPSNDPASPNSVLTIKADVKTLYHINPERFWLGDIRRGTSTNLVVDIRRTDGTNFVLGKVEVFSDMLTAHIESGADEPGLSARVRIDLKTEAKPRRFNEMVRLFARNEDAPMGTIYVMGRLLGEVVLTPEQLWWSVPDDDSALVMSEEQRTRRITVSSTLADKPLELSNPASSLKELNVSIVPAEAGKSFTLVAKLAGRPTQSLRGTISFETNVASMPKIEVPVSVTLIKIQKKSGA